MPVAMSARPNLLDDAHALVVRVRAPRRSALCRHRRCRRRRAPWVVLQRWQRRRSQVYESEAQDDVSDDGEFKPAPVLPPPAAAAAAGTPGAATARVAPRRRLL